MMRSGIVGGVLLTSMACAGVAAGDVVRVDLRANPGGNGATWATAFQSLSAAVTAAVGSAGRITEIRVGPGVYVPTTEIGALPATLAVRGGFAGFGAADPDARDLAAFRTIVSGDRNGNDGPGFANYADNWSGLFRASTPARLTLDGMTLRGARDTAVVLTGGGQLTVLACELSANQTGAFTAAGVAVTLRGTRVAQSNGNTAMFAGSFDVEGGLIEDLSGSAFQFSEAGQKSLRVVETTVRRIGTFAYVNAESVTVQDCLLEAAGASNLRATGPIVLSGTRVQGPGFTGFTLLSDGAVRVSDCVFEGITAFPGRSTALFVQSLNGAGLLEGCRFQGCVGLFESTLVNTMGADVRSCVVSGNSQIVGAMGVGNTAGRTTFVEDCVFTANSGISQGTALGVGRGEHTGDVRVRRCTFTGNLGFQHGGAMKIGSSSQDPWAKVVVEACEFTDNAVTDPGSGGAVYAYGPNIAFVDCLFRGNRAPSGNGGAIEMEAAFWGDGSEWTARIARCRFIGNSAARGGAIFAVGSSSTFLTPRPVRVSDSLFVGNHATIDGGGLGFWYVSPKLSNCTIVANRADRWGGGAATLGCDHGAVASSIVWDNADSVGRSQFAQVFDTDWAPGLWSRIAHSNSTVMGWTGAYGLFSRCDGEDPRFADPLGPDGAPGTGDEDFGLAPGSPAADAGVNLSIATDWDDADADADTSEETPFDLGRRPRRADDPLAEDRGSGSGAIVDRGCFESSPLGRCAADFDGDGFVGPFDYAGFVEAFEEGLPGADVNGDGFVDVFDYIDFVALFEGGC